VSDLGRVRRPLSFTLLALTAMTGGACVLLEQYDAPVNDPPDAGVGGHATSASSGGASASTGGHGGMTGTGSTSGSGGVAGSTTTGTTSSTTTSSSSGGPCTPPATQPCYSGPPGTLGVGACKGGVATCQSDATWGPCAGDVVPHPEDCATPADEDCDGKTPPCAGAALWARSFGDTGADAVDDLVTDPAGNVYVAGGFLVSADLGGGVLTSAGLTDCFLAKYGPDGAHLMSKRFGDAQDQSAQAVALDGAGNIFLGGIFQGSIDFGGAAFTLASAGNTDVFLAKLDATGAPLWAKGFGDLNQQTLHARGLAVDAAGDAVLSGSYQGSIDFGGGPLTSAGGNDVFLAKLDPSGGQLWAKSFGDGATQLSRGVALGPGGVVAITGVFQGSIDFGGGPLTSAGGKDVFVAVFDAAGGPLWSKGYGDALDQDGLALAFDGAGDLYVTGSFMGTIGFGGTPLVAVGASTNVFLAKLGPMGAHLLSRRYGDGAPPGGNARSVAVDGLGGVALGGDFAGSIDFGGGALVSAGSTDVFVTRLDPTWSPIFAQRFGNGTLQTGNAVAVDASHDVLLGGWFGGTITFGTQLLTSAGNSDAFVAKLGP
jgi:hypothetical protein